MCTSFSANSDTYQYNSETRINSSIKKQDLKTILLITVRSSFIEFVYLGSSIWVLVGTCNKGLKWYSVSSKHNKIVLNFIFTVVKCIPTTIEVLDWMCCTEYQQQPYFKKNQISAYF